MSAPALAQWLDEGLRLCQSGAWQDAEALYGRITETHPEVADGWNMLALLKYQRSALPEAFHAAQRATALRPGIAPYWLTLGNIAMAQQLHDQAQAAFRRAIRLEPSFAVARYRLGLSYHRQLAYADAAATYRQALQHAPDVAEIHGQLAEAYVSLDRPEDAMRAYEDAFRRDPGGELDRRGAFECLQRLQFDTLPEFWYSEILRFFQRQDVDRKAYVALALKALETKPCFQRALRFDTAASDCETLRGIDSDALLQALLRDGPIPHARFERLLTRLRAHLLADPAARACVSLDFLCALSLQCFVNGYVYAVTAGDSARIDALAAEVESRLASGSGMEDEALRAVAVLAAYRPLHRLAGARRLLAEQGRSNALDDLLRRSVHDVLAEQRWCEAMPASPGTTGPVGEDDAHPRWFAVDREPPVPLAEWLTRELPARPPVQTPGPVRVLVAGCSTGKDAIWLAANIAGAQVLGVDASRASLAHAQRMADELGIANVSFRHGDILALDRMPERFDVIVSTGALPAMSDPWAGLAVLTRLARAGGLLKIGLYSSAARRTVNAARELIAREPPERTEAGIRALRRRVLEAEAGSPLKALETADDFHSMSACRDLLFHGEERQFDVREIGALCEDHGLAFLGFSELRREVLGRYRRMFPRDERMDELANWHAYEQADPGAFGSRYLLWARCGDTRG